MHVEGNAPGVDHLEVSLEWPKKKIAEEEEHKPKEELAQTKFQSVCGCHGICWRADSKAEIASRNKRIASPSARTRRDCSTRQCPRLYRQSKSPGRRASACRYNSAARPRRRTGSPAPRSALSESFSASSIKRSKDTCIFGVAVDGLACDGDIPPLPRPRFEPDRFILHLRVGRGEEKK